MNDGKCAMQFSKDELEKIVSYIPYHEAIESNDNQIINDLNNAEIWHVGTELMDRLGVVSEIFNFHLNIFHKMKEYEGISENVKLEDVLKRFLDKCVEISKATVKNKSTFIRIFFDKFPTREFTTASILKDDLTTKRLYEILNDHLQSNDSITTNRMWEGTMVVSRVIPKSSKTAQKAVSSTENRTIKIGDRSINVQKKKPILEEEDRIF